MRRPFFLLRVMLVPAAGIEPAWEKLPRDFKSLASTNSATRACVPSAPQRLGGLAAALNWWLLPYPAWEPAPAAARYPPDKGEG